MSAVPEKRLEKEDRERGVGERRGGEGSLRQVVENPCPATSRELPSSGDPWEVRKREGRGSERPGQIITVQGKKSVVMRPVFTEFEVKLLHI